MPTSRSATPGQAPTESLVVDVEQISVCFREMQARDIWRVALGGLPQSANTFEALKEISLQVKVGEFVGLLGRNGAGKSTLLRTIGGIVLPDDGRVMLAEHAIGLYGLGISGHDSLTGKEFTRRWLELSGMPRTRVEDAILDVARFAELGDYFDRPMRTYSTGMSARVFFGAITAVEAGVYLIDEILVVGDEYFSAKSWRRMRARLAAGASGVFATHDWASMVKLCNRAFVLDGGAVVDAGNAPEVARRYIQMPGLEPSYGRFSDEMATSLSATCGEDVHWSFPVDMPTGTSVDFSLSVEKFMKGLGWQHLINVSPSTITVKRGKNDVCVSLPALPLAAGTYLVNVFLGGTDDRGVRVSLDARSWLYGNAIDLEVGTDRSAEGNLVLPVQWHVEATST
jgi:lipopolysaccharide transport system ATP-binding protein